LSAGHLTIECEAGRGGETSRWPRILKFCRNTGLEPTTLRFTVGPDHAIPSCLLTFRELSLGGSDRMPSAATFTVRRCLGLLLGEKPHDRGQNDRAEDRDDDGIDQAPLTGESQRAACNSLSCHVRVDNRTFHRRPAMKTAIVAMTKMTCMAVRGMSDPRPLYCTSRKPRDSYRSGLRLSDRPAEKRHGARAPTHSLVA